MGILDIFAKKETTEAESAIGEVASIQEANSPIMAAISSVEQEELNRVAERIVAYQDAADKIEGQINAIKEDYARMQLAREKEAKDNYERKMIERDKLIETVKQEAPIKPIMPPTPKLEPRKPQTEPVIETASTPKTPTAQNPCPSCGEGLSSGRCWSCGYVQ